MGTSNLLFRFASHCALVALFWSTCQLAMAQVFLADLDQQIDACSGEFYDSGGAGGNYNNNEDVTVTICPVGGAGSGPSTLVRFITWNIAGGPPPGDQLEVFDGVGIVGLLLNTGTSTNSLAGLTFTSTDPSGCLTFRWRSDMGGTAAGWFSRIVTTPWPGTNGNGTVCSNGANVNLFSLLGNTPDPGGLWTAPGGAPHNGTFVPSTDPGGAYTYTHAGSAPCPDASATVTISKVQAPNAGTNGTATFCATSASAALINFLGGSPDLGGTWSGPGGVHSGTFNPASDPAGTYNYTVTGTSPCANASATVIVTVNQPANAGTSGSTSVCSNDAAFQLFSVLGGSPQPTGAWTGPGGGPVVGTYTPGTSTPGVYTYSVPGAPPCPSAVSTVTVLQTTAPNAGQSRSITVCSDDAPFSMVAQLLGTPDGGGSWVGPGGPHGNQFNPASDPAGAYVYTVPGTGPCANASATLTITVNQRPNAGTNGSITLCSTDGVFNLFTALGGSPNVGGTWRDPLNNPHSGSFTPGSSLPGLYTYTVTGLPPCAPSSATVNVSVNTAPNAGNGASITRCSNDPNVDLFALLTGNPDGGGSWTGPGGAPSGTFNPSSDLPGAYTYTVLGLTPCANSTATINVTVNPAPNAGANGSITVCGNDASFGLFGVLGGSPDATGTWTAPGGGAFGGTFDPASSTPGVYTYSVTGLAPCVPATATVTVNVIAPPNPGTNGSITVCSSDAAVDLFSLLGGNPQTGGTWTAPGGGAHNGTYQPGTQAGGNYTYTVQGDSPCGPLSAVVQVTRVIAPNAGVNGTITVCSTNASFDMLGALGGNPNGTGFWLNAANQPVSGTFTPGTTAPGNYKYVVLATSPCVNDTGFVTVNVNQAPNAGTNASTVVCSNDAPFDLIDVLGGNPDGGGSWTRPNGTAHSGTFTPGQSAPGGYTYTVPGLTPCLAASAVVTVSVTTAPNPGTGGSITRCSNQGQVNLFLQLSGNPNNGGTWSGPGGAHSGFLDPATDASGDYVYTVPGTAPCTDASATINVTINPAPNAGGDGSITVCQGTPSVDLFTVLTGAFDLNGSWTEQGTPTGQLSGNFFNCGSLPPGTYEFRYEVPGIGGCAADHADVDVVIVALLDAGTNGTLPACSSNSAVNLFNGLGGNPQPGGQWIDLNSTGALSGQFFNATQVAAPGSYQFRYRLTGALSCTADSATVTVNVTAAQNPGCNGTAVFCSTVQSAQGLFAYLGCNPQVGGQWKRNSPNGAPFSGSYVPSADDPGTFFYVFDQGPPCTTVFASVTVTEVEGPVAGQPNSVQVCSSDPAFNMTAALNGTPDAGGQWFFNNLPHGSTFTPGLDAQGVYEYRVSGTPPCTLVSASLTVSVTTRANAGCNASVSTCTNSPPFLLFSGLTCNPDNNGFWLAPGLVPHPSGIFTPGSSAPGDYLYVVTGNAPCSNDTALVSVFVDPAPNAGCPGPASLCTGGATVNLFNYLGCSPDPFGTWEGPASLGNPPFNGSFTPGVSTPGLYTYTVTNGCGSASSTVTVAVGTPGNAGCNGAVTKCSNDGAFDMRLFLGCNPDVGGTWRGPLPSTASVSQVFTPGTSLPGTYEYVVAGTGSCPVATAALTVTITPFREAGVGTSIPLCETDGATPLFPLLGPTAMTGGQWFFNSVTPHSGTVLPSIDQSGNYVYRHAANGGCPKDSAVVVVTIHAQPIAGCDALITTCSNAPPFLLFNLLTCSPDANGAWFNPTGGIHTGIFSPGIDVSGAYKYRVPGNNGCAADSAYVTVQQFTAVDAGGNGVAQVCGNAPSFQLINLLQGAPQPGGTWYDPTGAVHSGLGTYTPGVSQPGQYKYKVFGTSPCANDSAFVNVLESAAPNPGISTLGPLCSSQGPVALITLLGGTPDGNGSWTYNNDPIGPVIDPDTAAQGQYTYTVPGVFPCTSQSATVVITITEQAVAGAGGSITACEGSTSIDLFEGLSGYTPGGLWSNNCGLGVLTGGSYDASALVAGQGCTFTYAHAADGPCPATNATVSLGIVTALDAGGDSSVQACRGDVLDLFGLLGGSPQAGGCFVNVDNASGVNGCFTFNTGAVAGGSIWRFDYVLPALPQCVGDTARVTIEVLDGPYAGVGNQLSSCSISAPINLGNGLSGGPDGGGQWFNQDWVAIPATYFPGNGTGVFHYVVGGGGICPADTASVELTVTPASNAGQSANFSICSSDGPFNLFGLLGATAEDGGSWQYTSVVPAVTHSELYDPQVDAPGNYVYTVLGDIPCPNATATVVVVEPQAPNAGSDASVALCSNGAIVLMRTLLGGQPAANGTWVYVTGGGVSHGENFDPATDLPGDYLYTVVGDAPCPNASATLTLSVNPATNAGTSDTLQACLTQTDIDLFAALGAGAQTGGLWNDVNGSGALIGSSFDPSVAGNGSWPFTYTVAGISPCTTSVATITVEVGVGGAAGGDSIVTVCGNLTAFDLFTALSGSPQTGGAWTDGFGTGALGPNGILNPSMLPTGGQFPFTYTINDPNCGLVTAVVRVTAAPYPVAGTGASLTLCSTSSSIDLFDQLGGNPDVDGSWTNPSGQAHGDFFIPGTHAPGDYTYTVAGTAPCADASAVVSITVNEPPNAGSDGALLACDTLQSLDLFTGLQGSPQTGGAWQDLNGSGGLSGGTLNTMSINPGTFAYSYTVNVPGCAPATAQVSVNVVGGVEVGDVQRECITRDRTYVVSFTITEGDAATYEVTGLAGSISASAPFTFTSEPLLTSQDFEAFVRDQHGCSEVRITGSTPCDFANDVFVPESFSPNGDGTNDRFVIPGIEGFPSNSIIIFNRWGAKLYEASAYDNKAVVWDGSTTQGEAPAGTYFYVLDLGNGKDALTGFIYLNR
ncbi:MAG: gliding motility-associated C-terminal domain-containing protein [Flavobacteriales bacterium]|nr:gliding motility-associated C-terminal domain-containing protein [Flavobacteriales bacterium]